MKNKFQKMNKSDLHYEVLKNLYQKGITPEDLDISQCYINGNIYQLVSKDGTVISSVDLNQVFQETNSSNVIQTLALIFFSFLTVIALILFQELFRFGSFEEYNSNEDKDSGNYDAMSSPRRRNGSVLSTTTLDLNDKYNSFSLLRYSIVS